MPESPRTAEVFQDWYDDTAPLNPEIEQPAPLEDKLVRLDEIVEVAESTNNPLNTVALQMEKFQGPDSAAVLAQERKSFLQKGLDAAREIALQSPETATTESLDFIDQVEEFANKELANPWAHEFGIEFQSKGYVEEYETQFYQRQVYNMVAEAGWLGNIPNALGLVFLPDYIKDSADATGASLLDSAEKLKSFVNVWRSRSKEDRMATWPHLQKTFLEATEGNELKAAILLMAFLDPTAEQQVDEDTFLGAIDWTLIGLPIVAKLSKLVATTNIVSRTAKLKSEQAAAKITMDNLTDTSGAVESALDRARVLSATDAHPGKFNELIPESVDGLSGEVAELVDAVKARVADVESAVAPVVKEDYLKLSLLDDTEIEKFETAAQTTYENFVVEKYKTAGYTVKDIDIVDRTHDTFRIRVNLKHDGTGPNLERYSPEIAYDKSGVILKDSEVKTTKLKSYFLSPEIWMESALKSGLVQEATLIGFQQLRMRKFLKEGHLAVWKGATKEETSRVSAVLTAGANKLKDDKTLGHVWTYDELLRGVYTEEHGLVKLSKDEISRYAAARRLFDVNKQLIDRMQGDVLRKNGYLEFESTLGGTRFGIPYRTLESVPINVKKFVHPVTGEVKSASKENLKALYDDGFVLTKLHDESLIKVGKSWISHTAARESHLKQIRNFVTPHVEGYIPRIYKDAPYSVFVNIRRNVDGSDVSTQKVVRLFKGAKEANAWMYPRNAKLVAKGKPKAFELRHYREMTPSQSAEAVMAEAGGLFIDPRGKHLRMGLDGDKAATVDPIKAMQRQLDFLAFNIPMNEWRISVMQRWINTAKPYMSKEDARKNNFNAPLKPIRDPEVTTALEKSREWIRDQLLLPTESERVWAFKMRKLADWVDEKGSVKLRDALHKAAGADPFSLYRSTAFHAMLGFLNPAQLWVQAQGASVAFSLDPVGFPRHFRQYLGLRTVLNSSGDERILNRAAKAAGMTPTEMKRLAREFEKTGLSSSIKTNADMEAMKYGFHMDDSTIKRVLDSGLWFYQEGEMFTRMIAYLTARSKMLKGMGVKNLNREMTREELIILTENATKKMFNMNRANRAGWQKGIMSIPTQFQQITAKYLEAFIGNKFTGVERAKVITGQTFLYGASGLYGGNLIAEQIVQALGYRPEEISDEVKAAVRDGFWGLLTELAFDEGMALGRRGAAISGAEQITRDIVTGRLGPLEFAAGAGGHVAGGIINAVSEIAPLIYTPGTTLSSTEFALIGHKLLSLVKTYDQGHKAYLWNKHQAILNSQSQPIVTAERTDNFDAIVWAKALGITSEAQVSASDDALFFKVERDVEKQVFRNMHKVYNDYMMSPRDESHRKDLDMMLRGLLSPYEESEQLDMLDRFWDQVFKEETPEDRRLKQHTERLFENGATSRVRGMVGIGLSTTIKKGEE